MSHKPKTITFDNFKHVSGGDEAIYNPYHKLDWTNFYIDGYSKQQFPGSGFIVGKTSGHVAAYSGSDTADLSVDGHFTLDKVNLTAAWDKSLTVDIYGYKDGQQLYQKTVIVTDSTPTEVYLGFGGVDDVKFIEGNGVADPKQAYSGDQLVYDDMVVEKIKLTGASSAVSSGGGPPVDHHAALALFHPAGGDVHGHLFVIA